MSQLSILRSSSRYKTRRLRVSEKLRPSERKLPLLPQRRVISELRKLQLLPPRLIREMTSKHHPIKPLLMLITRRSLTRKQLRIRRDIRVWYARARE